VVTIKRVYYDYIIAVYRWRWWLWSNGLSAHSSLHYRCDCCCSVCCYERKHLNFFTKNLQRTMFQKVTEDPATVNGLLTVKPTEDNTKTAIDTTTTNSYNPPPYDLSITYSPLTICPPTATHPPQYMIWGQTGQQYWWLILCVACLLPYLFHCCMWCAIVVPNFITKNVMHRAGDSWKYRYCNHSCSNWYNTLQLGRLPITFPLTLLDYLWYDNLTS